jgi:hypothetical protein
MRVVVGKTAVRAGERMCAQARVSWGVTLIWPGPRIIDRAPGSISTGLTTGLTALTDANAECGYGIVDHDQNARRAERDDASAGADGW